MFWISIQSLLLFVIDANSALRLGSQSVSFMRRNKRGPITVLCRTPYVMFVIS